jgi:hypothetical protein
MFTRDEIARLVMPDRYRRSIHDWFARIDGFVAG